MGEVNITEIFCTELQTEHNNKMQHIKGHEKAYALLSYAIRECYGLTKLPEIKKTKTGKPFFPDMRSVHFSISHTSSLVMCALSSEPIGCDIEFIRNVTEKTIYRVMSDTEWQRFGKDGKRLTDFFKLWTLKESVVKLKDEVDLRFGSTDFMLNPVRNLKDSLLNCAVYTDIPHCVAAACAYNNVLPDRLIMVDSSSL